MQLFIAGFIVAFLVTGSGAVLLLRKKLAKIRSSQGDHLKQIEELSKLTGGLAHEIKNPLSTIKINLSLVREQLEDSSSTVVDKQTRETITRSLRKIGVIEKETERVTQILDGFLRYVSRTELHLASVDINSLMDDMVDFFSPQAQSNSIRIRQGFYAQPLICKVDCDMLKQVILNLLINAQQAMERGGDLMIRTDREKENALIQVSDTGCGIAAEKLGRIFEAYYSSRPQGSGLGLPTAKRIIEAHKGSIKVDSVPGKGTSFTITLPLQIE